MALGRRRWGVQTAIHEILKRVRKRQDSQQSETWNNRERLVWIRTSLLLLHPPSQYPHLPCGKHTRRALHLMLGSFWASTWILHIYLKAIMSKNCMEYKWTAPSKSTRHPAFSSFLTDVPIYPEDCFTSFPLFLIDNKGSASQVHSSQSRFFISNACGFP